MPDEDEDEGEERGTKESEDSDDELYIKKNSKSSKHCKLSGQKRGMMEEEEEEEVKYADIVNILANIL